jgi:hypothetical protein
MSGRTCRNRTGAFSTFTGDEERDVLAAPLREALHRVGRIADPWQQYDKWKSMTPAKRRIANWFGF